MYCPLFNKYVSDAECDYCDDRSGFEVGTWREACRRDEHHPAFYGLKWWLKPTAFFFKFLICIRWITRRFPLKIPWMIWANREGWHIGVWKPNLSWVESTQTLEESTK